MRESILQVIYDEITETVLNPTQSGRSDGNADGNWQWWANGHKKRQGQNGETESVHFKKYGQRRDAGHGRFLGHVEWTRTLPRTGTVDTDTSSETVKEVSLDTDTSTDTNSGHVTRTQTVDTDASLDTAKNSHLTQTLPGTFPRTRTLDKDTSSDVGKKGH